MMNIRIADISDRDAWDNYVLTHPKGIAYQLFAWKEAVKNSYGFDGIYLIAEQNRRVKGILPLIQLHFPFMKGKLVSLPYCDAGGPLADSVEIEKELLLYALNFSVSSNKIVRASVNIRSTAPFACIEPELTVKQEKVRMLLDLPDCSESLLKSLKAKLRSQIKKPIRDGLTVQIGGKELLGEFYPLFAENMRDLGSPVHSRKWIQSILEAYKNRAQLVIVRMPDKKVAAGGVLLCHPHTVSVPWASSLRRYNLWNPNMLLYWTFLRFASDNGYKIFDFGRSTPGEGTFQFKKQWGAEPASLHWAEFNGYDDCSASNSIKLSSNLLSDASGNKGTGILRRAGETFFMNLPVGVSKAVAPFVRRYISL